MAFEHYRVFVEETKRRIYYINSKGHFEMIDKTKWGDGRMLENRFERIKGSMQNGVRRTCINERYIANHKAVYQAFSKTPYDPKLYITHKDGDAWNCSILNLMQCEMRDIPQSNKKGIVIEVSKGGERCVYNSIKQLAKELFISRKSVHAHIKGQSHSPYLAELKCRRIE